VPTARNSQLCAAHQRWSSLSWPCGAVPVRPVAETARRRRSACTNEVAQHVCHARATSPASAGHAGGSGPRNLSGPTHHSVETARNPHRKVPANAREPLGIGSLHDQVEVISLHREVDQPEASPIARFPRMPPRAAEAAAATRFHTCGSMRQVTCTGWCFDRMAGHVRLRRAAQTSLSPAPRRLPPQVRTATELFGSRAILNRHSSGFRPPRAGPGTSLTHSRPATSFDGDRGHR